MIRRNNFSRSRLSLCCFALFLGVDAAVNSRLAAEASAQWPGIRHLRTVHRRDESGIQFPPDVPDPMACNSTSTCVSVESCAEAKKRPADFKICGWGGIMPSVCCPAAQQTVPPIPESTPAPIRFKDPVPVAECAIQSLSLDVREKTKARRSANPYGGHLGFEVMPNHKEAAPSNSDPFVIGGTSVSTIEKWPFMVGIYVKLPPKNSFLCGGSLISKNTVLTAAHCFQSSKPGEVYVIRISEVHLFEVGGVTGRTEFETGRVVVHPDFRPPSFYNDIALVKIGDVPAFTDTLRPVCLSDAGETRGGDVTADVIGWGAKQTGGSLSSDLQDAELELVNNTECNKAYAALAGSDVSFPRGISEELLCAGNVGKPTDACQGDSGGPLVKADSEFTIRQIGIVAGGFQCGEPGIPGIYTRVSHYREWISQNLD